MFQKTKNDGSIDHLGKTNRIIEATIIKGDIEAVTDLRLDGVLHGNLKVKGRVVVGPQAQIIGNVECENADIEGLVEGILKVKDLLHIKETADVKGDLLVGRLSVVPGAKIQVKCDMAIAGNGEQGSGKKGK
ncbi:polymer-forming cytoskeletal protein [Myroides odoratimimus]|uniref:bactofilin family protein n=1 Tax=Myroides odoratimimus TaxID=76832 RepID=UPI0020971CAC|nr:polymer-forming cytoskeletal protein [Myroides odoratimimus]MCO7721795.1 polymer-forming cytoskeletal protein [Myroides odoratimimus]